ncbi:MAG: GNAT family N-acetyltransferase [Geodermatophilaceae bacterium]
MTDERNPPWPGDLRTAADSDAAGVQQLIGGCFAEYDGCVLDLEGIDAWMAAPASYYAAIGGQFWVLAQPSGVGLAACVGWGPVGEDRIELKNLYVSADGRRQGLGRRLVALVETSGREQAAAAVVLWSDTRFLDAHRLYESLGYQRTGQERALHDPSQSIEYGFAKRL